MPVDPEKSWIDTVNKCPPANAAPAGILEHATRVDARVTNKAQLQGIVGSITYTFNKALFFAQLSAMGPVPNAASGAQQYATAWMSAAGPSVMVVPPGSIYGAPSPATIWSVVASTLVDGDSLSLAMSQLAGELIQAGLNPVSKTDDSIIGPAVRRAFLALTYTIIGLDSTPTPAGPLPLVAAKVAVL